MEPRVYTTDDVIRVKAVVSRLRQMGIPEMALEPIELWAMEREEEIQNAQKPREAR